MTAAPARHDLRASAWLRRAGIGAAALAALAGCGGSSAEYAPATEQSLRDAGKRNDEAATKAGAELRGRSRAEADLRDADRREAERLAEPGR